MLFFWIFYYSLVKIKSIKSIILYLEVCRTEYIFKVHECILLDVIAKENCFARNATLCKIESFTFYENINAADKVTVVEIQLINLN